MSYSSRKRDHSKVASTQPSDATEEGDTANFKRQMLGLLYALFVPVIVSYWLDSFKVETNREMDMHKVETRLKQISYGKNTKGYDRYIAAVPKYCTVLGFSS